MDMPAERGSNQSPADVMEAVSRLKEVEGRFKEFHERQQDDDMEVDEAETSAQDEAVKSNPADGRVNGEKPSFRSSVKPWLQGRLIHRTEAEIKTHTSYLVFATLPQEWSEEQEAAAFAKWPCGGEKKVIGSMDKEARKQEKRELLQGKRKKFKGANTKNAA